LNNILNVFAIRFSVRLPCSTTLVIKNTKKKLYSLSASPFDLGITTKLAWLLMSKEKKLSKGLRDKKKTV